MNLEQKLEALLFFKGEPVAHKDLARALDVSEEEIRRALKTLVEALSERGLSIIENNDSAQLVTTPEASGIIEAVAKEELSKDIGKAGLETLTIVLYEGPVSRSEIDYIRGVNSAYIVRNLLIRGLIEKADAAGRATLYRPTSALLAHLGLSRREDLPEYESVRADIEHFKHNDNGHTERRES